MVSSLTATCLHLGLAALAISSPKLGAVPSLLVATLKSYPLKPPEPVRLISIPPHISGHISGMELNAGEKAPLRDHALGLYMLREYRGAVKKVICDIRSE